MATEATAAVATTNCVTRRCRRRQTVQREDRCRPDASSAEHNGSVRCSVIHVPMRRRRTTPILHHIHPNPPDLVYSQPRTARLTKELPVTRVPDSAISRSCSRSLHLMTRRGPRLNSSAAALRYSAHKSYCLQDGAAGVSPNWPIFVRSIGGWAGSPSTRSPDGIGRYTCCLTAVLRAQAGSAVRVALVAPPAHRGTAGPRAASCWPRRSAVALT